MKIYKKWWFWIIIILAICLIWFVINKFSPIGCSYQYNQIDNEVQSANYCNIDSDCKVLPLGGKYVEFGCYHYVNKDVDGEQLYNKMDNYWNRCTKVIDKCARAPEAQCINNKCIEKSQ